MPGTATPEERRPPRTARADLPFSFRYDGADSAVLLASWPSTSHTDASIERPTTTTTWRDPASDLEVAWAHRTYSDSTVESWRVRFTNVGGGVLAPLTDVLAIDVTVAVPGQDRVVRTLDGSDARVTDFQPVTVPIGPGDLRVFTTRGGRSTNGFADPCATGTSRDGAWPYWNLDGGDAGVIVALGWPGQWAAEFHAEESGEVRITAGMATIDRFADGERITDRVLNAVALPAGASFESPLAVVLAWQGGDATDAQNAWRRWFVDHALLINGVGLPRPLVTAQANDSYPGQLDTSDDEIAWLDAFGEHHATRSTGGVHDHWWLDAGWYEAPDVGDVDTRWMQIGTWHPDPARFPEGLRPLTDRAHSLGMATIVWTEPERVMPGTWLAAHHPEWLLPPGTSDPQFAGRASLLDFGHPDALSWAVDCFHALLRDEGIDVLREDFNINPLAYWNRADAPALAASRSFGADQGTGNWRHQSRIDGDWTDLDRHEEAGHLHQPQWGDTARGRVWPTGIAPGDAADTARTWIAPRPGPIRVTGTASGAGAAGSAGVVSIEHEGVVVWGPRTIAGSNTRGESHDLDLDVVAGDAVRFIVSHDDTAESEVAWDPVAAYPDEAADAYRQQGWAQIRYVEGHLSYWRQLRDLLPSLWIDSCAAGGRRMDILTVSESTVLLRSDWVHDPIGNQSHTHGVSSWIPFTGDAAQLAGAHGAYAGRSAMAPSFHLKLPALDPDADWSGLRRLAVEFAQVRDAYLGDYYPLTEHSVADDVVLAFQFHQRDGRGGFVQVFRRPNSAATSFTARLRGLEPEATYVLTDHDSGEEWSDTGLGLRNEGAAAILPEAPFATTISYRRRERDDARTERPHASSPSRTAPPRGSDAPSAG